MKKNSKHEAKNKLTIAQATNKESKIENSVFESLVAYGEDED